MKIELKNLKINLTFSKETTLFQADVFVNGKKVAWAENDGCGGCTNYHAYEPSLRPLLEQAEAYAKSLPDELITTFNKPFTVKSNLEWMIDKMVDEAVNKRETARVEKKLIKSCETKICWGVPNSGHYEAWGFKGTTKLVDIIKTPQGKMAYEGLLKKVKAELKDGEVILNKNIPI